MSRLSNWKAALTSVAPGWDEDSWNKALADTYACRDGLSATASAAARMVDFIKCRRGKKIRKA